MVIHVVDLFRRQAQLTPDATAVQDGKDGLTYRELLAAVEELAGRLAERGLEGTIVGIRLERSSALVAAVIGTLAAGCAYLPLDTSYPADRLSFMLDDARASAVISGPSLAIEMLPAMDRPASPPGSGPAYVLYTSGSTGRPKGVAMGHPPLSRLIAWHLDHDEPQTGLRTAQFAPISFDVSFQEIFSTLCAGGTLVLLDEQVRRDPSALLHVLAEQRVTRLFLPTVALHQLADAARNHEGRLWLRDVICAGEQLRLSPAVTDWMRRLDGCRLHNHYGPTETHVVTTHTLAGDPGDWPDLPPIGRPLAHVTALLLDPDGEAVEDGEPGELHLGGACLADGYLGRPELTAERFALDPNGGGRLYRTGDLARRLQDGNLEYLGRSDQQVKIRGYRVEPGEVEAVLARHRGVAECRVATAPDMAGRPQLVAYVVPVEGAAERSLPLPATIRFPPAWHRHLSERLPEFMVPAGYVVLDRLPLTPSGKVDRAALPAPSTARPPLATGYAAPVSPLEQLLAGIWGDCLQLDTVGLDDGLFELGGNSLLVVQIHTRICQSTGLRFPSAVLFENPTVRTLAERLQYGSRESGRPERRSRRSATDRRRRGTGPETRKESTE
ncbi:hypothetical protein GCM10009760_21240 [Kitasatospora kazusensis]|uniref:Carrier domain-containing protein n=1 Tax=Kitasatospora kazusensis TaxID=407974 RepID=A0ABN2ZAK2_9ACTN